VLTGLLIALAPSVALVVVLWVAGTIRERRARRRTVIVVTPAGMRRLRVLQGGRR